VVADNCGHMTMSCWGGRKRRVYFGYYLILAVPALFFLLSGNWTAFRRFTRNVVCTFCVCFVIFVLYPVAGPYYVFARPSGLMVDNLPAHLVYAALASGSSFGAAFPSSHVAATTASGLATFKGNRTLGWILLVPVILMPIATVYTQMHYALDAIAGIVVGLVVPWVAGKMERAV
jgi:membrane-associated phospholipid phosphatase